MLRVLARLLALVLLVSAARAQSPCHEENGGFLFDDAQNVTWSNAIHAVRFTLVTSFVVDRLEVFTGEQSGLNTLGVWSHAAAANKPLAQLSSGTWSMSANDSWQGAQLSAPVALTAGTTYWFAWKGILGAQASLGPQQLFSGQPFCRSLDGGVSWTAPFQHPTIHWKLRLFGTCNGAPTSFCAGDGSLATACPCANPGAPGRGCANSTASSGGWLTAGGIPSPDTIALHATTTTTQLKILLQGDTASASGVVYGDGVLCARGNLLRLGLSASASPSVDFPVLGAPSISARSAALGDPLAPGSTRWYQVYYRDLDDAFCPVPAGDRWNVTNGIRIDW